MKDDSNGSGEDFILCDFPKPVTVKMARKWLTQKDELAKEELVNALNSGLP